ncbi:MAG: Magnesium transport protein CorA [Pelotomaculum sp. PtaB.Bin104]|nr:MAG: Magnesium transport protein CorA [Pelotomaculum sp. PtaB.Bin104]
MIIDGNSDKLLLGGEILITTYFNGQEEQGLTWLDLTNPSLKELKDLSTLYDLHFTSLEDCLDPHHQPKFEAHKDHEFILLRLLEMAGPAANTVQGLTSKVAIFLSEDNNLLLTVHRLDLPFMQEIYSKWQQAGGEEALFNINLLLYDILKAVVWSYEPFWDRAFAEIDRLEKIVFQDRASAAIISDLYLLRSQLTVLTQVLWQSYEVIGDWDKDKDPFIAPFYQDIRERVERYLSILDRLVDSCNYLFNAYMTLSAHRTNQIIRTLTVLSLFFMPLTFIVGIYGMNFEFFPELKWRYGYLYVWGLMLSVVAGGYYWFRKKGWI